MHPIVKSLSVMMLMAFIIVLLPSEICADVFDVPINKANSLKRPLVRGCHSFFVLVFILGVGGAVVRKTSWWFAGAPMIGTLIVSIVDQITSWVLA